MHQIRVKLLKLSQRIDTSNLGLRQLAKLIGEKHPQLIKYHLEQMEKETLIHRDKTTGKITVLKDAEKFIMPNMVSLPILGSANCGTASCVAEQDIQGYLQTSAGILGNRNVKEVFVIKAVGNSLNAAQDVVGGRIEDGDMVIIDKSNQTPKNGDYVLSIIDDAANLKRFYRDADGTVRLVSESTENIPPILIHPDDFANFMINGVVVRVIKN